MLLLKETKVLQELILKAKFIFETHRQSQKKVDFYNDVKPFADKVDRAAEHWEKSALDFLNKYPQKYIHAAQIAQTADNAKRVGAHAYFFETSKAKFIQSADSALYVLESLEHILNEKRAH